MTPVTHVSPKPCQGRILGTIVANTPAPPEPSMAMTLGSDTGDVIFLPGRDVAPAADTPLEEWMKAMNDQANNEQVS